jgi:hypothetical protein
MPKDGGPVTTIASNQGQPTWLRIYGDSLYWIARSAQTLVRAPLAGGGPFVAATSPNAGGAPQTHPGINGYTVSPTGTVYFSSGKRIYEASAAGTSRVVIEEDDDFPSGLALDGDKMVFLLEGSGHLHSARLPDAGAAAVKCGVAMDDGMGLLVKACEFMRSHGIVADSLFARDGRLYYVDNVDVSAMSVALERVNRVVSGDRIGGVSEVANRLNTLTLVGDRALVMADSYVAETELVPLSLGVLLARNQPLAPPNGATSFLSIAADATDVYWAMAKTEGTDTTCSIVRVARP